MLNLLWGKKEIVLSSSKTEEADRYLSNLILWLLCLYSPERTLIISYYDLLKSLLGQMAKRVGCLFRDYIHLY